MPDCKHFYKIDNTRQVIDGKVMQKGTCVHCGDIHYFQVFGCPSEVYRALPQKAKAEYPERLREMAKLKFLYTLGVKP